MQIELTEQAGNELQRQAEAAGVGVAEYLEKLVLGSTEPASDAEPKKPYTVEEWRAMLERSDATSGRNGRPWREFIHEGHKY